MSTWIKYSGNPILGNAALGTCFDVNVIAKGNYKYNMYFSWRPKASIAFVGSDNGTQFTDPVIVLPPDPTSGWEDAINRNCVIFFKGQYHMWYTGQARGYSKIGYATSEDGLHFKRASTLPVMIPEYNWEGQSVMNPYVIYDEKRDILRMWYAAGETYEPNCICYAESKDGLHWEKSLLNPIFVKGSDFYDKDRIGGCEVHALPDGTFAMFYIGYEDINTARICIAFSPDGITQWKRCAENPIVSPTPGDWDQSACYKPSVAYNEINNRWLLWYNGRNGAPEYVGLVIHEGSDIQS